MIESGSLGIDAQSLGEAAASPILQTLTGGLLSLFGALAASWFTDRRRAREEVNRNQREARLAAIRTAHHMDNLLEEWAEVIDSGIRFNKAGVGDSVDFLDAATRVYAWGSAELVDAWRLAEECFDGVNFGVAASGDVTIAEVRNAQRQFKSLKDLARRELV